MSATPTLRWDLNERIAGDGFGVMSSGARFAAALKEGERILSAIQRCPLRWMEAYKELVKLVASGTYVVISQSTIARLLGVSRRTALTILHKLCEVGLIWQERDAGGPWPEFNRYYISAYVAPPSDELAEVVAAPSCEVEITPDVKSTTHPYIYRDQDTLPEEAQAPPTPQGRRRPVLQFDGRTSSAKIASATRSEDEVPVTPATELLRAEVGVQSPAVLRDLADTPVADVRAAVEEAKMRSNVRSLPGFVVHLIKEGFKPHKGKGAPEERTIDDYTGYCPVCFGYPFCKCEEMIARAELPPDQEATVDPELAGYLAGYCEACCGMTYGNCPCWTGPDE